MLLLVVLTELCGDVGDLSVRVLEYVLLVTVLISEGRYSKCQLASSCMYSAMTYAKHAQFSILPLLRSSKPCCCSGHS